MALEGLVKKGYLEESSWYFTSQINPQIPTIAHFSFFQQIYFKDWPHPLAGASVKW